MTRCVIYAAKSTTDEHGSIASQLQRCREYAAGQGWTCEPADEFHDEAASAYRGSRGPGLIAARARAAKLVSEYGETVLLVFASDRLARGDGRTGAHLVEYVLEATKAGYRIESVSEDLGGQMALILAALYGERAHVDSKTKGEHVKRGRRAAAERGRRNGGPRPYGYRHVPCIVDGRATSRLEIVVDEAAVVQRMFRQYAGGASQSTIARELNVDGVRTVRGVWWSQTRVAQTLANPLYRGMVRNGDDLFDGEHESIVDDELWYAVEAMRGAARRGTGRGGGRPPRGSHLLTGGLLRCSCGASMRSRTHRKSGGTWEAYLCDGRHSGTTRCALPAISRAEIDTAVWHYFERVGLDVDAMVREHEERRSLELAELATQITAAERQLATVTEQLGRIRGDYRGGKLPADDWLGFRDEIGDEIAAASAELEQLRTRAREIETIGPLGDTEWEVLDELRTIRETLAGVVTGASDLAGARQALRRVFSAFTLHRRSSTSAVVDDDPAGDDWYIVPHVRPEVVLTPLVIRTTGEAQVSVAQQLEVQKTTIPSGEKPKASGR